MFRKTLLVLVVIGCFIPGKPELLEKDESLSDVLNNEVAASPAALGRRFGRALFRSAEPESSVLRDVFVRSTNIFTSVQRLITFIFRTIISDDIWTFFIKYVKTPNLELALKFFRAFIITSIYGPLPIPPIVNVIPNMW